MSQTIYMELLDEGTDVWRPVQVEPLADGTFCVLGPVPQEEKWTFSPGTIVKCKNLKLSGGVHLTAYESI